MSEIHESIPVLVGAAQETFRDLDPSRNLVDAFESVLEQALDTACKKELVNLVDSIYVVPSLAAYMPELNE